MPKYETKLGSVSFKDDPLAYCQNAYDKADKYNRSLIPEVVEDRAFFHGYDPNLEKRKNDRRVARSAQYVPELRPAIETREAAVLDRAQEDSLLIRFRPKEDFKKDNDFQDLVREKTFEINEQLRQSQFLFNGMMDWIHGAELQPVSVMKVGYLEKMGWKPNRRSLVQRGAEWFYTSLLKRKIPDLFRTEFNWTVVERRPDIEWLDFDEFLWDPSASSLDKCRFVIHRRYLDWNECLAMAESDKWNMKNLVRMKEDEAGDEGDRQRIAEETDEQIQYNHKKYMREDKYLICEFWIKDKDELGRDIMRVVILGNNHFLLSNSVSDLKGIEFPFVVRVAWPKIGAFEGTSSVSRVKSLQILFSDVHNAILDAASYGILPPIFKERTTEIFDEPKWAPLAVIEVDKIDGIKTMEINLGHVEILPPLAQTYEYKIRQELNAPEESQGIRGLQGEEKATKTQLRTQGAQRRLRPLFQEVKDNLIEVVKLFIKINQITDPDWILLDKIEIDIPAFSGAMSAEQEKTEAIALFEWAKMNPLYANTIGQFKLLQLGRDVLNKHRKDDVNDRILTEEELKTVMKLNLIMQGGAENAPTEERSPTGAGRDGMEAATQ